MDGDTLGMLLGIVAMVVLFIALPWLILHYVTKWKQAPKITVEDEQLLDDMFNLARRLEERLTTVERIAAADHPDWKPGLNTPHEQSPIALPLGRDASAVPYSMDRRN